MESLDVALETQCQETPVNNDIMYNKCNSVTYANSEESGTYANSENNINFCDFTTIWDLIIPYAEGYHLLTLSKVCKEFKRLATYNLRKLTIGFYMSRPNSMNFEYLFKLKKIRFQSEMEGKRHLGLINPLSILKLPTTIEQITISSCVISFGLFRFLCGLAIKKLKLKNVNVDFSKSADKTVYFNTNIKTIDFRQLYLAERVNIIMENMTKLNKAVLTFHSKSYLPKFRISNAQKLNVIVTNKLISSDLLSYNSWFNCGAKYFRINDKNKEKIDRYTTIKMLIYEHKTEWNFNKINDQTSSKRVCSKYNIPETQWINTLRVFTKYTNM